ncbi:MAG: response regulator transcription factor [Simkaniaceae bacterium]|nr:response regulator transcription factor [Simkaniaceae bacterium]
MPGKNIVILVDDDEDLLHILEYLFQNEGYGTESFTQGKPALNYLLDESHSESIALVVLDRILPDMDGIEILMQIQEKHQHRIPVLILSALDAEKDVLEGLKRGALDYIGKPFNQKILMEKARSLISRNT